MKLTNPTDDELNAAFAENVAGWHHLHAEKDCGMKLSVDAWFDDNGIAVGLPRYTHSVDDVLPWIKKFVEVIFGPIIISQGMGYFVQINRTYRGESESIPRAAVIAILRAHNVEIEFIQ